MVHIFIVLILSFLSYGQEKTKKFESQYLINLIPFQQYGKYGYRDTTGKILINPQFDIAEEFSEGLAAIMINRNWGYIDTMGKIVIKPDYDSAGPFIDGLAQVKIKQKYGFIEKTGKLVINQLDNAYPFSENLAAVKVGDKWGYINKNGEYAIKPKYKDARNFFEGLAAIQVSLDSNEMLLDKWGYINKKGDVVIIPKFDSAGDFLKGLARIKIVKKYYIIDIFGKVVQELGEEVPIIPFWRVEVPPKLVSKPVLDYPREKWITYGLSAVVHALVDTNGKVIDVNIIKASDFLDFDEAVKKAAWNAIFTPAENKGQKVRTWVAIPFHFQQKY